MLTIIRQNALTLAVFAIITTGITAIVNYFTAPIIDHQAKQQYKNLLDQVIPPKLYNNNIQNECYLVNDNNSVNNSTKYQLHLARKGQIPVAAAIETVAPDGYSGSIKLLVGADFNGKVLGVRVIESHETPGLGDKIELRVSNWIKSFCGKIVKNINDKKFAVKKDGGEFEQFTGATITPRAVVNTTKRAVLLIKDLKSKLNNLPQC